MALSVKKRLTFEEKMRGECYVRLLVHPDAASAKKAIVPYIGDMMNPDISLVMGANRPGDPSLLEALKSQ